jgi:hypothetical protein
LRSVTHNEEDEMGNACSTLGRGGIHTGLLVEEPDEMSPLGRPGCRWEDNVKMDLRRIA